MAKEEGQVHFKPVPPQDLHTFTSVQQIIRFMHVQENQKQRIMIKPGQMLSQIGFKGKHTRPLPLMKPME